MTWLFIVQCVVFWLELLQDDTHTHTHTEPVQSVGSRLIIEGDQTERSTHQHRTHHRLAFVLLYAAEFKPKKER
jgi:hypothetical protein